jgi:hypothetical protein
VRQASQLSVCWALTIDAVPPNAWHGDSGERQRKAQIVIFGLVGTARATAGRMADARGAEAAVLVKVEIGRQPTPLASPVMPSLSGDSTLLVVRLFATRTRCCRSVRRAGPVVKVRVHALILALKANFLEGVVELTSRIRSLQGKAARACCPWRRCS